MVAFSGPISRQFEQIAAILVGVHPKIWIVRTAENERQWEALEASGITFIVAGVSIGVLFLLLVWEI